MVLHTLDTALPSAAVVVAFLALVEVLDLVLVAAAVLPPVTFLGFGLLEVEEEDAA